MSLWRLVTRSISFYWRTNLAVLLAVVVATGVLTGALAVGDSVRFTLQKTLAARLGQAGRAFGLAHAEANTFSAYENLYREAISRSRSGLWTAH